MLDHNRKNGSDSIEELKKRLYARGSMGRRSLRKGGLEEHEEDIGSEWKKDALIYSNESDEPTEEKIRMGTFKKFFIASSIFFMMALAYAAYQFLGGGNIVSAKNINITVFGPSFASGGDEISLQVSVENRNNVPLEFAEILIEYPRGAASANASSTLDLVRKQITLKKIPAGGTHQEVVKVVLYGEEGGQQNIKFTLEYRTQGSNAIFQKESIYPVKISSAPINLFLDSPKEVNSGQNLSLRIKVSSNAPKDVADVLLGVDYPPGFLFKTSDPAPTYGNNVWRLGDFHTGSDRAISITGVLSGENGEDRTFRLLTGSASVDDEKTIGVIYNSVFQTISIKRAFLDAVVYLNGDSAQKQNMAVPSGREVVGSLVWRNNLPTRITNAEISLKFSGNAIDRSTISSQNGFYNSSEGTLVWNMNNYGNFQVIEPGETGQFPFYFRPLPLYSSQNGMLNEPQVVIETTVKGNVNTSNAGGGDVSVTTSNVAKVLSDLQVLSRAAYFSGSLNNTGPIPPVAEKETTYTVSWSVMNSANDVTGASITTVLPLYVGWANQVSSANEDVSYDVTSRKVTWRLGTVSSGTGYGSVAREVSFQVRLTPSIQHVGNWVNLTGDTVLSGVDSFAKESIESVKNPLTTILSNDSGFRTGDEIVMPPSK
ncbi:MAG: hypothetical protein WC835_00695 [Candidatus Paceibacterota bacterium]|jgi:hypothetical protein